MPQRGRAEGGRELGSLGHRLSGPTSTALARFSGKTAVVYKPRPPPRPQLLHAPPWSKHPSHVSPAMCPFLPLRYVRPFLPQGLCALHCLHGLPAELSMAPSFSSRRLPLHRPIPKGPFSVPHHCFHAHYSYSIITLYLLLTLPRLSKI